MSRFRLLTIASTALMMLLCVSVTLAEWTTVWQAGAPGREWPIDGVGGGADVDFIQETGTATPAPGNPANTGGEGADRDVDDDYYFAGTYPDPIGVVANDEIAFERAFVATDNDLRIHFNLPSDLSPDTKFRFSLEPFNLDQREVEAPNSRYGVEVLFNGTVIFPELVVTPAELGTVFTSAEFTAADVGAAGGANVINVHGIAYNAEGGGNWMGIDYHALETVPEPGCLSMMLCGILWMLPLLGWEKQKGYF